MYTQGRNHTNIWSDHGKKRHGPSEPSPHVIFLGLDPDFNEADVRTFPSARVFYDISWLAVASSVPRRKEVHPRNGDDHPRQNNRHLLAPSFLHVQSALTSFSLSLCMRFFFYSRSLPRLRLCTVSERRDGPRLRRPALPVHRPPAAGVTRRHRAHRLPESPRCRPAAQRSARQDRLLAERESGGAPGPAEHERRHKGHWQHPGPRAALSRAGPAVWSAGDRAGYEAVVRPREGGREGHEAYRPHQRQGDDGQLGLRFCRVR